MRSLNMILSIALFFLIGVFATTREDLAAKHLEAAELATAAGVAIHKLADAHAKRARYYDNLKPNPEDVEKTNSILGHHQYHRSATRFYRKKGVDFDGESTHHLKMHALSQNPETELSDGFIRDSFKAARKSCKTSEKATAKAIRYTKKRRLKPCVHQSILYEYGDPADPNDSCPTVPNRAGDVTVVSWMALDCTCRRRTP